MIIPKTQTRFCKFCRKHTEHVLEEAKRRPRRQDTKSQRRFLRKLKGYGSFPKENPKGREKPTRKVDFRYKCSVCNKKHSLGEGYRIKKIEWKTKEQKTQKQTDVSRSTPEASVTEVRQSAMRQSVGGDK